MIIRRMYLWSFQAFIFLSAGELKSTFILWGLSEWKASEGNTGFVDEMNFLSVKTDFCSCDKYEAKAFKEKTKKVSVLARAFILLFSYFIFWE